jgi:hypothetical protein
MIDVYRQSLEFRACGSAYRARAEACTDGALRDRLNQLASRYTAMSESLESLAIATAIVETMEGQSPASPGSWVAAAE